MTLLFSFAEAAYFLLRRNMRRRGALVALGILATVGTFCAVQSFHYGELRGIQANAAFNVYLGNNRGADGRCYLRPGARWRKFHSEAECAAARRGVPVDAVWRGRIIDFWLEHPFRGVALWCKKALLAFSPSEYVSGSDLPELLYFTRVVFWGRFLTPAVFLLAGVGLWGILRRGGYRGYEHFLLLFFALWAAQIVTVTSGRYRLLMLVPCFLFAAAGALAFDWKRFWYLPLAVVFVCALFTVTDYGGLRKETASLYAELAFRRGDLHQADELAAYVAHSRFDPDPVRMANLRGAIAEKLGDADAAKRHYLLASKLAPAEPQAWMNLANLAAASGERSRAGELYRKALKLAPRSPQALYNYARFRFNCGEECEADIASALDSDPAGSAVWNLAGLSAMRRGDRRRAAECFGRAAAFAPEETRELYLNNRRVALGNER